MPFMPVPQYINGSPVIAATPIPGNDWPEWALVCVEREDTSLHRGTFTVVRACWGGAAYAYDFASAVKYDNVGAAIGVMQRWAYPRVAQTVRVGQDIDGYEVIAVASKSGDVRKGTVALVQDGNAMRVMESPGARPWVLFDVTPEGELDYETRAGFEDAQIAWDEFADRSA